MSVRGTPVWNPGRNPPVLSRTPLARQEPPPLAEDDAPAESRVGRFRRRLTFALVLTMLAVGVMVAGRFVHADSPDRIVVPKAAAEPGSATAPGAAAPKTAGAPKTAAAPKVAAVASAQPVGTSGSFTYVGGFGPVVGSRGPIHRFKIAVEKPTDGALDFANAVNRTLGDRRSWIASRRFRFQRVPESARAEFIVYLASARTSEKMCRTGGLETGGFTSCRVSRKVIINDDRWRGAIKGYGASLETYRAYAINHEVGHQLGHGHQKCSAKGKLAPVMMQQTYGLKGCRANSWPYP
ncbi:hypothetical protein GCM10010172_15320 [Paractinoplanes ferrugineus]|uniref:DUF3152 domain-containing protein n=1 Tax=Paractinoplanes ferrugineus TaxID=113564 RepID=A0A919M846_9ACTN|nr:DUF3152 domain-containing protein [Actinoplanes ferrugineus]GIE10096.1 hypothetical protein Afe05nite_19360 [Actinoplanes ferrugineus]